MTTEPRDELTALDALTYPVYTICGTPVDSAMTYKEFAHWEDHAKKRDLTKLQVELAKAGDEASKAYKNTALQKKIDLHTSLSKSYQNLLRKLETNFSGFSDDDFDALDRLPDRIAKLDDEISDLTPDPEASIETSEKHLSTITPVWRKHRLVYLEFAHWLATSRGQTNAKFSEWSDVAKNDDFDDSLRLVEAGKSQHGFGATSKRQREQRNRTLN
jgi:hypothetical protein